MVRRAQTGTTARSKQKSLALASKREAQTGVKGLETEQNYMIESYFGFGDIQRLFCQYLLVTSC